MPKTAIEMLIHKDNGKKGSRAALPPLILLVFIIILCFGICPVYASNPKLKEKKRYHVEKGVITEIIEERIMQPKGIHTRPQGYKLVKVKITSGERKGEVFQTKARLSVIPGLGVDAKPGVKVLVHFIEGKDEVRAAIVDYDRERYVYVIVAILFVLLIVIGKMKGLKAVISLCCTLFMVLYVLLPLLKQGYNPISTSIATSVAINIIVFLILTGFTRQTRLLLIWNFDKKEIPNQS